MNKSDKSDESDKATNVAAALILLMGVAIIVLLVIGIWRWLSQHPTIVDLGIIIICILGISQLLQSTFHETKGDMIHYSAYGKSPNGSWRGNGVTGEDYDQGYLWATLSNLLAWYGFFFALVILIRSVVRLLFRLGMNLAFLSNFFNILSLFLIAIGVSLILFGISFVNWYTNEPKQVSEETLQKIRRRKKLSWIGMGLGIVGGISSVVYLVRSIV